MKPKKRSFTIAGHKTSISIEEPFWTALRDVAASDGLSIAALVARIDQQRQDTNLSSAVRVYLLGYYRDRDERLAAVPGSTKSHQCKS